MNPIPEKGVIRPGRTGPSQVIQPGRGGAWRREGREGMQARRGKLVTATYLSGRAPLLGGRDLSGHAELAVVILLGHHSEDGTRWTVSYNGGRQSLQRPAKEKKNVPEPLHKEVEARSSQNSY